MIPIIIINWNGINDTKHCIESVLIMQYQDFEIHLIDNGSKLNQVRELEELYSEHPKIHLHFYKENYGFTKAHLRLYHEVLKGRSFKYLALLNNDTEVDPKWLGQLFRFAEHEYADIVSSKMIRFHNRKIMDNAGHKMLNTGEIIPLGHDELIWEYDETFFNLGACAGACLYSKEMLDNIGFFDSFFDTGYEDAELGLRAVLTGYKSAYCPDAIVYHKMGASIKKIFNDNYVERIQTNILYSYFKLMPTRNIILNLPSIIFKNLAVFIVFSLSLRFNHLKVQRRAWRNLHRIWPQVMEQRRIFYGIHGYKIVSPVRVWNKMTFFLKVDLQRFWNIFIKRRTTALEQYGN